MRFKYYASARSDQKYTTFCNYLRGRLSRAERTVQIILSHKIFIGHVEVEDRILRQSDLNMRFFLVHACNSLSIHQNGSIQVFSLHPMMHM